MYKYQNSIHTRLISNAEENNSITRAPSFTWLLSICFQVKQAWKEIETASEIFDWQQQLSTQVIYSQSMKLT